MFRCIAFVCVALLLSACQTDRVNRDFDAQRDFGGYGPGPGKNPACNINPMIRGSKVT
jgi:hypothetical protein